MRSLRSISDDTLAGDVNISITYLEKGSESLLTAVPQHPADDISARLRYMGWLDLLRAGEIRYRPGDLSQSVHGTSRERILVDRFFEKIPCLSVQGGRTRELSPPVSLR